LKKFVEHLLNSACFSRDSTATTLSTSESGGAHTGLHGRRVDSVSRARLVPASWAIVAFVTDARTLAFFVANTVFSAVYQCHFTRGVVTIRHSKRAQGTSPSKVARASVDVSIASTVIVAQLTVFRGLAAFVSSTALTAVVIENGSKANPGTVLVSVPSMADTAVVLGLIVSVTNTTIIFSVVGYFVGLSTNARTTVINRRSSVCITVAV
jgi:hypothetical protein